MKTRKKKVVYSGNQVDLPYMEFIQNNLFNMSHPVESIFETTNSSCNTPENLVNYFKTLFGVSAAGTWERFGEGKVVVGYQSSDNDFKTIGGTGGSKYLQAHTHTMTPSGTVSVSSNPSFSGSTGTTESVGGHTHSLSALGTPSGYTYKLSGMTRAQENNTEAWVATASMNPPLVQAESAGGHSHSFTPVGSISGGSYSFSGSQGTTSSSGSGAAQNLQPYIVVYRYRRIS